MSTYDHQKILTDWSNGTLTADMAIGHSLQHIAQLYELLAQQRKSGNDKVNHLENKVTTLQAQLDRLVKGVSQESEKKKSPTPNLNVVETMK